MVATAARYEVLELLGSGGFGTVYRARYTGEGGFTKEVALKFLNAPLAIDAELTARLRDEARVLGLLRHRAILHVDTLTQIDGQWTIVMEYVEGHDLTAVLRRGAAPAGVAVEIVAEVASALHAAYTRAGPNGQPLHLVHQDLKPSNIRLTPHGEVKVLDFGIARADFEDREVTGSSQLGTVAYMAPERFDRARRYGAESDIYSLGAVLFELLTGKPLGPTRASPAAHQRTLALAADALERLRIASEVAEIVLEMLAFDPAVRPTADALETRASALARRISGESLRAWAIRVFPTLDAPRLNRGRGRCSPRSRTPTSIPTPRCTPATHRPPRPSSSARGSLPHLPMKIQPISK